MDYSRQQMIEGLTIPKIVSIVGCGGTGAWVALKLAMSGTEEIILFDDDIVEESNLARLPYSRASIGNTKLDSLYREIIRIRSPRVECHNTKIDSPEKCVLLRGVVFCCTDNIQSQQLICAYCRKNNLRYQRVGYDGTTLCVTRSFPLTLDDPSTIPAGYEVTPSWVVPASLAADAGIASQCLEGGEITLMDDIRRLHIQDCSNISGDMVEKLKKEGRKHIEDNPHDYGMGYCDDCSKCDDCDRISIDDTSSMRDIVCDDCNRIDPGDARQEIIEEIKSGNIGDDIRQAILSRFAEKEA
jgi:molybdopterin/thiamine biosynthesis adenylyltransferase